MIIVIVLFIVSSGATIAQELVKPSVSSLVFKTQFFQIKDQFNYGLVFSGVNLVGCYIYQKRYSNSSLIYTSELCLGANSNIGVGFAAGLIPVDLFYGFDSNRSSLAITSGFYLSADYNMQFYPELQSGHMAWFTSLEMGPKIILKSTLKKYTIKITFSNSIAGFTSRPNQDAETYFYSLSISDLVNNSHHNLKFGTYNLFNYTNFEFEMVNIKKRLSIAYEFEYFGYYVEPKVDYLAHSLNLIFKVGKS